MSGVYVFVPPGVGKGGVGAGCAHPGLQLSDTSRPAVNVLDGWSPEINAVILQLEKKSLSETVRPLRPYAAITDKWHSITLHMQDSLQSVASKASLGNLRPTSTN